MEYQKPIYFTVTAPSLDEARSFITVVSADGTIVDWCHFSHFEQVTEEEWKLVFIITKPYYYITGEDSVRHGYVTGILYSSDDSLCKKIKIDDDIKIRQEGCLFEWVSLVSDNVVMISQGCDSIEFLNTIDIVYSNCSDEKVEFVSNIDVEVDQECEEVVLLISHDTVLKDACDDINQVSSFDTTIRQDCQVAESVSNNNIEIEQSCEFLEPISNNSFDIEA